MRLAVSFSGASRRPVRTTAAPADASASAELRPMPLPAPVTSATLPANAGAAQLLQRRTSRIPDEISKRHVWILTTYVTTHEPASFGFERLIAG